MNQSKDRVTSNDLKQRLSGGLIPATPVPFDSNGTLHVRAHDSYLRYMADQAIAGAAVWAHTGRGLFLDTTTAQRVMQDWRSALPNKVLIAGVGASGSESSAEDATKATLRMAESAFQLGADALLSYAPTWLRHHPSRDKLIVEYHFRISQLGLPFILFYLYEAAGGVSYTPEVLDELLSLPNVVGIKVATLDSVMTYQDVAQQLQTKHPDKLLITGEDRFLGYSLRRGAQAALIGMAAVCCELQSELIRAHFERNAVRFLALSDSVDQLAEGLFVNPMEGYVLRILYALAHLGVIPRDGAHDPWGPNPSGDEFARIGRVVNSLMAYTS
jgi:4-hydroxy-tetrahydrodipicolinate synthase